MLEGKKISELEVTTELQQACCFPVLNNGVTRRITYGSLLSEIENDLPESGIEQVKQDVEKLKTHAKESEQKIDALDVDVDNLKNEFDVVDEMVQGQNATINNCVSTVEGLEQIIESTHFDNVLALEEQVRTNTSNIERKQDALNAGQTEAVNSGITAEKVAQYDAMESPIDDTEPRTDKAYSSTKVNELIDNLLNGIYFKQGETYGNPPNVGYTTEYPCALYNNNNSNITIVLPKSCGNLTPSWVMGSTNYMVCNGQRVDVTNNTVTVRKISEYIIRIDIAGTYPNCSNLAGIFATNGKLTFN